jgi:hypothetical protein
MSFTQDGPEGIQQDGGQQDGGITPEATAGEPEL